MGDLTDNLSREEFACRCGCGVDFVDIALPAVLQACVNYFQWKYPHLKIKIKINSGTRCRIHNAAEGGKEENPPDFGSMHLYGMAADFYLYDAISDYHIPDDEIADYLENTYLNKFGIGRYKGRTHVDTRKRKARWDKR